MTNDKENLGDLKVGEIKKTAAGISAVVNATKTTLKKAGAVRGTKLLLALNQKGGIDCMSCAWADPEGERTHAEFCENGAKAIADEADTRRVTPEFFAKYSVAELSAQSDQWLNAQGRISLPAGSRAHRLQRRLLEEEGVVFRAGRVDLSRSGTLDLDALLWRPRRD